jgi:hypothetical protein
MIPLHDAESAARIGPITAALLRKVLGTRDEMDIRRTRP